MFTLVIGGSASGKSEYAERLTLSLAEEKQRIYLATMEPFGEEAERRIARHREARRDRGFETLECFRDLEGLSVPAGSCLLLEDMGNLAANELYGPSGAQDQGEDSLKKSGTNGDPGEGPVQENDGADDISAAERRILRGTDHLQAVCSHVTVVTNEVFSGGQEYAGDTERYLRLLARINRALAERADCVVELCCGLPRILKGKALRGKTPKETLLKEEDLKGKAAMIFVTGPLFSGKQECIMRMMGWDEAVFAAEAVRDVQELAAEAARGARDQADQNRKLQELADSLARKRVVISTEVGGGIVPLDPVERRSREAAGRLACLLADRALAVIQVSCGIPRFLKGGPKTLEDLR